MVGIILKRIIPVSNYKGVYPLTREQLKEWALLDTFDMLAPEYDSPQTTTSVKNWFEQSNLTEIEIFHGGHLVGRGKVGS